MGAGGARLTDDETSSKKADAQAGATAGGLISSYNALALIVAAFSTLSRAYGGKGGWAGGRGLVTEWGRVYKLELSYLKE